MGEQQMNRRSAILGLGMLAASLAIGAAFMIPQIQKARDASGRSACQGNFMGISLAMQDYHDKYGHFPPAFIEGEDGKPAHSWRVLLLEFLDYSTFVDYRFDEPWNGLNNRQLEDRMLSTYACPADRQNERKWQTNYFVVVGQNTVFPGSSTVRVSDIERPHSETILVVEAMDQGIHWMEPRDISFDAMSFAPNDPTRPSISSSHLSPMARAVDRTVIWPSQVAPERLREMLLIK